MSLNCLKRICFRRGPHAWTLSTAAVHARAWTRGRVDGPPTGGPSVHAPHVHARGNLGGRLPRPRTTTSERRTKTMSTKSVHNHELESGDRTHGGEDREAALSADRLAAEFDPHELRAKGDAVMTLPNLSEHFGTSLSVLRGLLGARLRHIRYIDRIPHSERLYSVSDVSSELPPFQAAEAARRERNHARMLAEQSAIARAREERAARAKSPSPPTTKTRTHGPPTSPNVTALPPLVPSSPTVAPTPKALPAVPEVMYRRICGRPASRGEDDR